MSEEERKAEGKSDKGKREKEYRISNKEFRMMKEQGEGIRENL
ncbi:MAG: hypothetical protein ACYS32_07390 [Planctomycetota bacterium]|jgi:hypothetical protein